MTTPLNQATVNQLAAAEPAWLAPRRLQAWEQYGRTAMPTRRDYEWQRLDIRAVSVDLFCAGNGTPVVQASLSSLSSQLATAGFFFSSLADALRQHGDLVQRYLGRAIPADEPGKFAALHNAFWSVGACLYVPRGVRLTEPLEVTYRFQGRQAGGFPRTLVILEPGAEATLVQRFVGGPEQPAPKDAPSVFASATEVFVEEGARLHYISLQDFAPNVYDFSLKRAEVAKDAEVDWVLGMFGGSFLRYDVQSSMNGEGAMSYMYGAAVGTGRQQLAQFTRQHHRVGNTTSDLLFKNVLRQRAVSNYTGTIKVEQDANGTNAYQSNRNLVLDKEVQCDTRPVLEIESNQLRCTHGATVGRLDPQQLYYLQSRGLPESSARDLLIEAFLNPVLDRVRLDPVREEFRQIIRRQLEA
jgi:Fe-S cluster assembly protein SufD